MRHSRNLVQGCFHIECRGLTIWYHNTNNASSDFIHWRNGSAGTRSQEHEVDDGATEPADDVAKPGDCGTLRRDESIEDQVEMTWMRAMPCSASYHWVVKGIARKWLL